MRPQTIDAIMNGRAIAIARGLEPDKLTRLAEALLAGGLSMMELTFDPSRPENWRETCEGIAALSARFAGRMRVGAGTVLTVEQARMACEAGALYIISPDANPDVIRATREMDRVSIPGCMTPTEIASAQRAGADFVKLFPAGHLGPDYVRAVRAPLSHVKMLAVGGIDEGNAAAFIRAGCCGVGIGGRLVNKAWIAAGEFGKITACARACAEAVRAD